MSVFRAQGRDSSPRCDSSVLLPGKWKVRLTLFVSSVSPLANGVSLHQPVTAAAGQEQHGG